MDNDTFAYADWIVEKRTERGWSQADLARHSGLTRTAISQYELRKRTHPDERALSSVARALGYPPETLLRLANILPPVSDDDEITTHAVHLMNSIANEETRKQAITYLEYLVEMEGKRNAGNLVAQVRSVEQAG